MNNKKKKAPRVKRPRVDHDQQQGATENQPAAVEKERVYRESLMHKLPDEPEHHIER